MKKIITSLVSLLFVFTVFASCASSTSDSNDNTSKNGVDKAMIDDQSIDDIIAKMSPDQKVGQLFFVRLNQDSAINDISEYQPSGFILFANDFEHASPDSIKAMLGSYQKASIVPLLLGVDEEGGIVNRISKYKAFRKTPFLSPQAIYEQNGMAGIKQDTIDKAELLQALGLNVNLAPVCDVSQDSDDYIYNRSFGKNAKDTAEYVSVVVAQMKDKKLGSVLKHFPGYGNNKDTHTGISIDSRTYDSFVESDFIPFQAGISVGADAIMVSHNIVNAMDSNLPASISPRVHEILRRDLGFGGVIMTDDLMMDAIKEYTDYENIATQAILAGNDMIISSDYQLQIPAVIKAVDDGVLPISRLDESVKRILTWKKSLGLI